MRSIFDGRGASVYMVAIWAAVGKAAGLLVIASSILGMAFLLAVAYQEMSYCNNPEL
jgi:hypothetical protein